MKGGGKKTACLSRVYHENRTHRSRKEDFNMKRGTQLFIGILVAALLLCTPLGPVEAQNQELTVLVWSHFIPDVDEVLKKHAEDFGKMKGVTVRIDTIAHKQFVSKKAAEAQARSGHDIIMNYGADPLVYDNLLADVSDLVGDLNQQYGGLIPLAAETCQVKGRWKSVPWYYYPYPLVVRTDLIEQVGETPPDTWDDVLRIGTKLKKIGKPILFSIVYLAPDYERKSLSDSYFSSATWSETPNTTT